MKVNLQFSSLRSIGGGVNTARLAPAPVPQAVGTAALTALHASGYVHPAMPVTPGAVSLLSNHPLPALIVVALAVRVGGGNVATVPVDVYCGSFDAGDPALDIVAGG